MLKAPKAVRQQGFSLARTAITFEPACHSAEFKAECRLASETNIVSPAVVCNLSTGGMHLISARRFGGGAILTVRLFSATGDAVVTKRAKVRYVRLEGDTKWLHSSAFMKGIREDERYHGGAAA
jgi:hypothetical protein